jgi:hypothetical protein
MTIDFLYRYCEYLTGLIQDADTGEERERLRSVRTRVATAIAFWSHG